MLESSLFYLFESFSIIIWIKHAHSTRIYSSSHHVDDIQPRKQQQTDESHNQHKHIYIHRSNQRSYYFSLSVLCCCFFLHSFFLSSSFRTMFSGYFAKWFGITVMRYHARIDVIVYVCLSVCVCLRLSMCEHDDDDDDDGVLFGMQWKTSFVMWKSTFHRICLLTLIYTHVCETIQYTNNLCDCVGRNVVGTLNSWVC